jgi:hypothetical protein
MAKSKSTRATRRKRTRSVQIDGIDYPIVRGGLVEVDGHRLSKLQVEQLEQSIAERRRIAERPGSDIREWQAGSYARNAGLKDLLWKYQPAAKAEARIRELWGELSRITSAIASLREYSFYQGGAITEGGCVLLQNLIGEAETKLARLRHFADSMAMQRSTKLHDWVAREKEFEQIGKGARP